MQPQVGPLLFGGVPALYHNQECTVSSFSSDIEACYTAYMFMGKTLVVLYENKRALKQLQLL